MKMIHTHTGVPTVVRLTNPHRVTAQHYDTLKDTIVYPIRHVKHSVEEDYMLVTLDPFNTEVETNAPLRVIPISKLEELCKLSAVKVAL